MNNREDTARQIADQLGSIIERANAVDLETLVYVLETAKIEALRATRQPAVRVAPREIGISPNTSCDRGPLARRLAH